MFRQDISIADIATKIAKKPDTAMRKVNGEIPLKIEECIKIATLFEENNSLDYLFKRTESFGSKEKAVTPRPSNVTA